ncbi:hypothetical protein BLNAU_22047 [Blattamonas nauphoetae]|uniref:Serine-threonine/tyrosine-protein kinase catalytic domain-containing protein n=1 Tax=Blattamonas nauphoetae TaxID=2049346 RepID=A0ABQ9WU68_9EUKA|nr:hypothetical protein BLNAU_22047 [Blattamonas nauphoetae]
MRLPSTFPCSCSFLTRRLIGVSVSESTNHLSGTSGMPLDWAGSSLLSNSSFSSSTTNDAPDPIAEPMPEQGKDIDLHESEDAQIVLSQPSNDYTVHNQVWIVNCAFSTLSSSSGGAAVSIDGYRAAVVVKDSSFEQCRAPNRNGGAIYVFHNLGTSRFSFTLFNCDFTNNTAEIGGHLSLQAYHPVTVAQCTFADSRSTSASPLKQRYSLYFIFEGNCRFDNSTISNNEGSDVGGIYFNHDPITGSITLTDVLFKNNVCTNTTVNNHVSDCIFRRSGSAKYSCFDCFSTSAHPRIGTYAAGSIFPNWIGPSITSFVQTNKTNENEDGFEVVLSFEGVFTGTSRKYDVTLESDDGTVFVAEKVSFSKIAGTVTIALNHPSVPCLSSSTTYSIVDVKKSASQSTSNEFVVGGEEEPDWTWWHHTAESRADKMVGLSFTTPKGPTLTKVKAEPNTSNLNEAIVVVTVDRILAGSFELIVFDASDELKTEISIGSFTFAASSTQTSSSQTVMLRPLGLLSNGKTYKVKSLASSTLSVSHSSPPFSVPAPPTLTDVRFTFATASNTTFHLILEGTDLPVDETFLVSLKDVSNPIEVTFSTPSEGSSAELALGWSDTLQFDTAYPLVSVVHKGSSGFSMPFTDLTLETGTRPDPLSLFACDSGSSDPKFCGSMDRPCSSVDVAWMSVEAYSAQTVSLVLVNTTLLSSQMVIKTGQSVIVEKHVLPPSLVIPSTASLGDSASLVSVAGALVLEKVDIDVQIDALSFVLFDVNGGKLMMDSVHISGVPSSSDVLDGIEGLCSWETGLIKLHEGKMDTHSCEFSSIGMGEIWMESSNLSLSSTQILSNGMRFSLFPLAQQDVMCKSGHITILPSASDTTDDHWISSTPECSVVLNGSELKSPHFVPSLDANKSKSTLSKKKDSFSVLIVGSKLLPCGLKLEVSESSSSSSQSSQSNSSPVEIPLSFSSADLWNETHINLSIASSSLSALSLKGTWSARLLFGQDGVTESFTFLNSLKDRKAESLQQSLPWLIPVIVCSVLLLLAVLVVVVVVVCRRQRQTAKSDSSTLLSQQELSEDDVAKMEVEMHAYPTTNGLIGHKVNDPQTAMASDENGDTQPDFHPESAQPICEPVQAMKCEGQFEMEIVDGQDTLYNRIHTGDGIAEGKRREIERKIVRGMLKMVEKHNLGTGTRISPHWILLNRDASVFIRVESENEEKPEQNNPSLPNHTQPSVSQTRMKDGIEEIRWRSPEQGEKEGELKEGVEASKVMVFRLGLIVWEIETGLVPFGELDAVNAHRNLAAGIALPLQKVSVASMRELITGCLQIDADQRITLQQVLAKLEEMPKGSAKEEMKDPFAKL